jgi:hypothetical protein
MTYPFVSAYDPVFADPAWEAAVVPALSDASDATFIHFDAADADGHLNLVLRGDPAVIPADSSTVTAVTFTIRARTLRADDDPYPVSMGFYLADPVFDGAMEFVNYVEALDDNRMGLIIPNTPEWAETTVTLDEAGIQDGLGDGQTWAGYEATWTDLAGFVDHLRTKGGFEVWLERNFTGMWDLAGADLSFVTPNVDPVSVLMQGETLTRLGEGAVLGALMSVSAMSAATDLTEDFEGGSSGTVITPANTIFDAVGGLDAVFTTETAHSGSLSARSSGPISTFSVPYDYEGVTDDEPASGSFWFRFTGTSPDEAGIFMLYTSPAGGVVYTDTSSIAIEFVHNGTGFHVRRYQPTMTEQDVTVPASTWIRCAWSFDTGLASFSLQSADGTSLYSFTDLPVDGRAFAWTRYYVNDYLGFTSWLDDVGLTVTAAGGESVDLLMQAPVLTQTGGS